jgi:hypothetical protein
VLVFLLMWLPGSSPAIISAQHPMADVFSIIADPSTGRAELLDALRQLGPITERADFWSGIANSAAYRQDHRRQAVFALFRRHVSPGTTLADLARLLDGPTWLVDDDISVMTALGGKIPVAWTLDDTAAVLSVFPGLADDQHQYWAIYLRIGGQIDEQSIRAALRGAPAPSAVQQAQILEIGYLPADSLAEQA